MVKNKIIREHQASIIYSEKNWAILKSFRERAKFLMEMLKNYNPFIYGSIARGDVHEQSDIDIVFIDQIPAYQIELHLEQNGFKNYFREIIMATPKDAIKLYIHLSDQESITIPLTKLESTAIEFYDFGGKINLFQLKSDVRVSGIDKRLVLIKPTIKGHDEMSIINNEHLAAKELGISINTINERIKVLLKREKYGRTGVILKRSLDMDETAEVVLKKLATKKSIIRKKLYQR